MSRITIEYHPDPDVYRVLMPDALGVPRPIRDENGRAINFRHEVFASPEVARRLFGHFENVDKVFCEMMTR